MNFVYLLTGPFECDISHSFPVLMCGAFWCLFFLILLLLLFFNFLLEILVSRFVL